MLKCHFCNRVGEKETASDFEESMKKANEVESKLPTEFSDKTKLTWLCPEEVWICNECLIKKIKSIPASKA